jgi:hypothetical protein
MPLPRVFVSSVVEGFQEFRQSAREGIEAVGAEPVMVNEDFPSLATSSRNACLDAVASSDIYIAIIGERGGWRTPSQKLVVEEEYEFARTSHLPTLLFVQDGPRDADADRLVRLMSDYIDGRFRVQFRSPEELRRAVEAALRERLPSPSSVAVDPNRVSALLQRSTRLHVEPALHYVILPERNEEIIEPMRLDEPGFEHDLYELALDRDVRILRHEAAKEYSRARDAATIRQEKGRDRTRAIPETRIAVSERGHVVIDSSLTGRRPQDRAFTGFEGMMIVRGDVEEILRADFAFTNALYEKLDPYRRHERFLYGVAMTNLRHKEWVEELRPTNSMSLSMQELEEPLLLLPESRVIGRDTLRQPEQEIERVVTYARRALDRRY